MRDETNEHDRERAQECAKALLESLSAWESAKPHSACDCPTRLAAIEKDLLALIAEVRREAVSERDREWHSAVHDFAPVGVVFSPQTNTPDETIAALVGGSERPHGPTTTPTCIYCGKYPRVQPGEGKPAYHRVGASTPLCTWTPPSEPSAPTPADSERARTLLDVLHTRRLVERIVPDVARALAKDATEVLEPLEGTHAWLSQAIARWPGGWLGQRLRSLLEDALENELATIPCANEKAMPGGFHGQAAVCRLCNDASMKQAEERGRRERDELWRKAIYLRGGIFVDRLSEGKGPEYAGTFIDECIADAKEEGRREERERLEHDRNHHTTEMKSAEAVWKEARQTQAKLVEALRVYGGHAARCRTWKPEQNFHGNCDCGFSEALALVESK